MAIGVRERLDVREARSRFPGLSGLAFLDAACVSLAPRPALDAVGDFLSMAATCEERDASLHHVAMDRLRGRAVREGAALLGAAEDEIALVESTTHGLNIAAQTIPFEPGDNVVIADLEFLQVAIPWVKLREKGAITEVRMARNVDGALPVASFAEVVDAHTKAVVVSSVQWCNGYRVDLSALGRLCRDCGSLLVVDAIQELGALALDVRRTEIDLLVAGGHKWLNSPFGCGLLYLNRKTLPMLDQASWGYLGLAEPKGGWPRYFATPTITPVRQYEFPRVAKSFEINGTANYPGAVALGASLGLVNAIGIGQVEARVLGLAAFSRRSSTGSACASSPIPRTASAPGSRRSRSPTIPARTRRSSSACSTHASTCRSATPRASAESASRRTTSTTSPISRHYSAWCGASPSGGAHAAEHIARSWGR